MIFLTISLCAPLPTYKLCLHIYPNVFKCHVSFINLCIYFFFTNITKTLLLHFHALWRKQKIKRIKIHIYFFARWL